MPIVPLLTVSELCILRDWGLAKVPNLSLHKALKNSGMPMQVGLPEQSLYSGLSQNTFANSVLIMPLDYISVCLYTYFFFSAYLIFTARFQPPGGLFG